MEIKISENLFSLQYHLSLCVEGIPELIRNYKSVIIDIMDEDSDLASREIHIWCNSVQDRILLVQIACGYKHSQFIDKLVVEAISLVENYNDCAYILKANIRNQFLTLQQTEDLFVKATEWAEYTWEYLELIELKQQRNSVIFDHEHALEKAIEHANTCFDCCSMGEFYAKIEKDSDKACLWYNEALNLVENDDDREEVFKSIGRFLNDEKVKGEIYEQFFDQAQDMSLKLTMFCLLKSKFWNEQKAKEKWADFCYEIILKETWQDLHHICDKFYTKGTNLLRKLIENGPVTEPKEVLNMLAYARFLKLLYCNKRKAEKWISKAFHLQIEKDTLEHQAFLSIATSAWKELNDISFTHEIIKEAASRIENIDEYYQILNTINETSKDKSLMKHYYNSCIAKEYATHEYYRIASFASVILQDDDLANSAAEQALKNVYDYNSAMLIRSVTKHHELDRRHFNKSLILMHQLVSSCEDAIDLAENLHVSRNHMGVEKMLVIALKLAKSAEDYSFVIRFVNFWLSNTSKAQFILDLATKEASKESDFKLLVKDAKLIYGLEWEKAF